MHDPEEKKMINALARSYLAELKDTLDRISLEDLGKLSSQARNPIGLAATCTAWSQAEVIVHMNANRPKADLAAGINDAMAARVAILARSVGCEKDLCMTGGVAKNIGVLEAMEHHLDMPVRRLRVDPQIIGALGAAVFAAEKLAKVVTPAKAGVQRQLKG